VNGFSRTFLVTFTVAVLCIAAFNALLDPYVLFDTPRVDNVNRYKPTGLNFIRLSKGHRVSSGHYEALILGSSRTGRGLNCELLGYADGGCYNASTTAATPAENFRYLQQQSPQSLDRVYLGLDLFTIVDKRLLNASFVDDRLRIGSNGKWNYRYYKQFISDYFGSLVSYQVLEDSRLVLRSQQNTVVMPLQDGMPEIHGDGSWGEDSTRLKARAAGGNLRGRKQEKRFVHLYHVMTELFQRSRQEHREAALAVTSSMDRHLLAFRDTVEYCHAQGLDLKIFFNTAHAYYWQLVYEQSEGRLLDYWKRRIVEINKSSAEKFGAAPFPVFDFSGFNTISTEEVPSRLNDYRFMDGFQDIMHYNLVTGGKMVDIMAGDCRIQRGDEWGICVDSQNIQAQLRNQRRKHRQYARGNQSVFDDFEQLLKTERRRQDRIRSKGQISDGRPR
jgi:hypothetical protein